jgi:hypothetical protein
VSPVAGSFIGTGEFVPERVWSCPVHDRNPADFEEGDPWVEEGEICLDCETGLWLDAKDADGVVVMREVGAWELMLLQGLPETRCVAPMLATLDSPASAKISWLEDPA